MAGAVLRARDARRLRCLGMLPPLFPTSFKYFIVGFSLRKTKEGRSLRLTPGSCCRALGLIVVVGSPDQPTEEGRNFGPLKLLRWLLRNGFVAPSVQPLHKETQWGASSEMRGYQTREWGLFVPGTVQPLQCQHTQGPGQIWCSLRLALEGFSMGKDTNYPRGAAKTLGQGMMRCFQPPSSLPSPWDGICLPARSLPAPASYPSDFTPVGRTPWAPGLAEELLSALA